jgi:hypothetical protein
MRPRAHRSHQPAGGLFVLLFCGLSAKEQYLLRGRPESSLANSYVIQIAIQFLILLKYERGESGCLSVDIFRAEQAWTGRTGMAASVAGLGSSRDPGYFLVSPVIVSLRDVHVPVDMHVWKYASHLACPSGPGLSVLFTDLQ